LKTAKNKVFSGFDWAFARFSAKTIKNRFNLTKKICKFTYMKKPEISIHPRLKKPYQFDQP